MPRKLIRQKYFLFKELRISVALIILWTLLVTAFFTYFAKELGGKIGTGTPLFIFVMLGYVLIVVVLTLLFSHRLIGPFDRLKTEMRLIRSGEYRRRLSVRKNDDIYIRSFIEEVNRVLDAFEKTDSLKKDIMEHIDSEMASLISVIEDERQSGETVKARVLEFNAKIRSITGEKLT